ncbi:MAG: AAA family ATPase [Acidimicrobiales bacterium]
MRPTRLELEGFTAFRTPTVVDFEGADLFALTGPTGAGKSSLIDAMVFALYGCVPRYGDRRLVAPAISQGGNEARVRLDFTVQGAPYVAARVVRRTKTGATTKEARLETADGQVLAGNERELSEAVADLLGLGYDHFCKCVVLPQGRFADFLHDKPEARQELLVELLDLGVYRQMGRRARQRATEAGARADAGSSRLSEVAWATPEARSSQAERVECLGSLQVEIEASAPALDQLTRQIDAARAQAGVARERAEAVAAIRVPGGVADLGESLASARAAVDAARHDDEEAERATERAERRLDELGRRSTLERIRDLHRARAGQLEQLAKSERILTERRATEEAAAAARARAEQARAEADGRLERVQHEHRAHAVAEQLAPGEPCPVCRQVVVAVPATPAPASLAAARRAADGARREVERCRGEYEAATRERQRIDDQVTSITDRLAELDAELAEAPDADTARRQLDAVAAAEAALTEAREAEVAARKRHRTVAAQLDALRGDEEAARRQFDDVRDRLAQATGLQPPSRTDALAADWGALADWAGVHAPAFGRSAADAEERAIRLDGERQQQEDAITDRCAALEIVPHGRPPRDAVVDALAQARAELARLDQVLAEASRWRQEAADERTRADVAATLGRHLSATGFETWVLDEALSVLVVGATETLYELSGGQYSLDLDPNSRNFVVLDHRNADQPRPARTLSGGETFLASLALALALADQLSLLAARGAAQLESIFLDEGFGTLDPTTLDVVTSAVEELGARGRMVGLVSHVAELAERVPVRFVVTKVGTSASVERVEA